MKMAGWLTKAVEGLVDSDSWETVGDWTKTEILRQADADWPNSSVPAYEGSHTLREYAIGPGYGNTSAVTVSRSAAVGSSTKKRLMLWHRCWTFPDLAAGYLEVYLGGTKLYTRWAPLPTWENTGWLNINSHSGTETVAVRTWADGAGTQAYFFIDKLLITAGDSVTVTNLQPGNKIEVYQADDTLLGSDTVGGGGTSASVNCESILTQPFQGYIKVYDTDGVTLLHTSPTQALVIGDSFAWSAGKSYMTGPAASLRIYKAGAVANPKTQAITFTLRDLVTDLPISGKVVTFSTSLGSVAPASDTTDANGEIDVTITSGASLGWAVVKASFAGDASWCPCNGLVEVAVYDEADSGDVTKPYQVFIQGVPTPFTGGTYRKSIAFDMQDFSLVLPDIDPAINAPFEVIIYRRGIKDFVGRITKPVRTITYNMTIPGKSNHWKLARRVANKAYAAQDPHAIIDDVLTRYPAGVSQGIIGTFGTPITHEFNYETDLAVIRKLVDITGWKARLNLDDSVDFAPDFGETQAVTFARKGKAGDLVRETDFGPLDTRTFLIGDPSTLVSDKDDATAAAIYGLVEQAFFDKNATTQTVLDSENQVILDSRKVPVERISGAVIDLEYAADAYDVFDWVTVTDVDATGLSGTYRVVAIERNLTDCGAARIELSNLSLSSEDLLAQVARIVKDLSS
jgi:hypothetical protein